MTGSLEVFFVFLRLGLTGFGGPLAHVAMFEEEFVRRRKWISPERFLERVSLTQLIPGPNSTELSMQIGYERAGWPGFLLGGFAFILPSVVMVAILGCLYQSAGGFTVLSRWVWGTRPVVGALIAVMLYNSIRATLKPSWRLLAVAVGFGLYLLQQPSLAALAAAAGTWMLLRREFPRAWPLFAVAALPLLPISLAPAIANGAPTVLALLLQMLYLGSMVVGSGYVLFSYFSAQLVDQLHWVDGQTLTMAIAAGQLTPGPLFASAVFFGQILQGWKGALACAVGIFAPAFLFSALAIPLAKKLESSPWWKECLQVMAAVCVLMLSRETVRLLPFFLDSPAAYLLFFPALASLLLFRVNSSLLVLLGALAGLCLR